MCEERQALGAVRQPVSDEDACVVDADKTPHSPTTKNEERFSMDAASLPPSNGDDDAGKTARSRTTRARVFLAMGLAVEVYATLWAFQQAASAGALYGDVDCGDDGRLPKLYDSSLVVAKCDGQIDIDVFRNYLDTLTDDLNIYHNLTDDLYIYTDTSSGKIEELQPNYHEADVAYWEECTGCGSLSAAPTAQDSFEKRCSCLYSDYNGWGYRPCSWVALSHPGDDICYAQGVFTNSGDGSIDRIMSDYGVDSCWPTNPPGTKGLTITALVVALSSQLLEAFVGFKYWKDTEQRTAPTLAGSVFEALGVLTVSSVLLSLPGLYTVCDETHNWLTVFFWTAWTIVIIAVVGALAEITAECSGGAAGRLSYLGAVGNGLIWLGAALVEVVVTTYIVVVGNPMTTVAELAHEIGGLFALEVFGLVAMWIARGLWTRAKLLRSSVKSLDRPLRKRAINTNYR